MDLIDVLFENGILQGRKRREAWTSERETSPNMANPLYNFNITASLSNSLTTRKWFNANHITTSP